jgi:hypothetical protein
MAAILRLNRFQLFWLCEGFVGKSHLRWDGYPMMVNDVFPQLNESEFIYTYAKRDLSWYFEGDCVDETPRQYFLQMLARFNPANQYRVTMKKGREKQQVTEDAYLWDGKYYVGWNRYCDPDYVKKVEQKPYRKCRNGFCAMKEKCLRFTTFTDGDKLLDGIEKWSCDKCDLVIERDEKA